MKLDRFYSAPRGKYISAAEVGTAIMDRSVSEDDYYTRLANTFPAFSNPLSTRLIHQLTTQQFTFERDCGPNETTAMNRSIGRGIDPYSIDMPAHIFSVVQGARYKTAHIFGSDYGTPDLELFASQRTLWATAGASISSLAHIDNKLRDAREFGLGGFVANGVSKKRCRTLGINPRDFGMMFFDHREIPREAYNDLSDEFFENNRMLGEKSMAYLHSKGGWQIPVNTWVAASDCMFHTGMYLSDEAKARLPKDASIGFVAALNVELRNRTAVFDPVTGRTRGADISTLCFTN